MGAGTEHRTSYVVNGVLAGGVLFWIIGIFNTAVVRPEDVGSWKNWLGWLLVALAVMDTVLLFRRECAADGSAEPSTADP